LEAGRALEGSPKHARHELAYVLNDWRKHSEHRADMRETYEPMPVWWPRTWLLSEGWRRHGLISTLEVPAKRFVVGARE
jgi:hypothetical protein